MYGFFTHDRMYTRLWQILFQGVYVQLPQVNGSRIDNYGFSLSCFHFMKCSSTIVVVSLVSRRGAADFFQELDTVKLQSASRDDTRRNIRANIPESASSFSLPDDVSATQIPPR